MTQPLDMLCWTPCFQRGRKQKSLTLSSISRASFTKQVQTGTQSPNLRLPFTLGLTSGRCSFTHCFPDRFMQTRPPWLSHLCFSLGAAWKEGRVPVHGRGPVCFCLTSQTVEVWLPVLRTHPQSQTWISSSGLYAGSAQLVKAGTDRRCTDRGSVDFLQFLSVLPFPIFFPLFWHW